MIYITLVSEVKKDFMLRKELVLRVMKNPIFINYKDSYYIYLKKKDWPYLFRVLSILPNKPTLVNLLIRLKRVCSEIHLDYKLRHFVDLEGCQPKSDENVEVEIDYFESGKYHTNIIAVFNKN